VHGSRQTYHRLRNFLDPPDGTPRLQGTTGSSFRFVWRVLILKQEGCMVCAKRTIGSEIVLDATNGTPRDVDQVRSHFGLFGCKVGARFVSNIT
jgi:hypothetical protein